MGEKEGGVFRNTYKGHTNKNKEVRNQGREVGMARVGRRDWGESQTTVLEQQ